MQRAFDQVLHDTAIAGNHVILAVDRAGIVGEDGETHQGIFDLPLLTAVPGIKIYSPATYAALKTCLRRAVYEDRGVTALRYPRGKDTAVWGGDPDALLTHIPGTERLIITYGRLISDAYLAKKQLEAEGISSGLLALTQVWPLPDEALAITKNYCAIDFFEESSAAGGIAEKLAAALLTSGWNGQYRCHAVTGFVRQAPVERALAHFGLTADEMANTVRKEATGNDNAT